MATMPAFAYEPMQEPIRWEGEARRSHTVEPASKPLSAAPDPAPLANTAMHGGVVKALAGLNAYILLAFGVTLRSDREALFMVAISAFYLVAYLGTPYLIGRVGGKRLNGAKPFVQFLEERFEIWGGRITGREAMIQVLTVPAAIAVAVTGMCFIIASYQ